MVLRDKFSATHFLEDCRKHNVTVVNYIGEVCRYLVARPRVRITTDTCVTQKNSIIIIIMITVIVTDNSNG